MGMGFIFRDVIYESPEVTPYDGDSYSPDEEGGVRLWGTSQTQEEKW